MSYLLINYMFLTAIPLLVLYALFAMTLRNETFFGWNRIFLILSILVSFILPCIHLPVNIPSPELITAYIVNFTPQEVTVEVDEVKRFSFPLFLASWKQLLFYVYFAGVIFFTLRILVGLFRILYLIYQYGIVHYKGNNIVFMYNNAPHFSFFYLVFINRNFLDAEQEGLVLIHEKEHLRQRHFIDLILLELLIVFQWFNPAAWLYRHSLKRIHEYQADSAVVKSGHEISKYMYLIFNQMSGFKPDVFINKFNFFILKKRIIMMSKRKSSKWEKSRILLAVPIIALLLVCFDFQANSQENTPDNKTAMTVNSMLYNVDAEETAEFVDFNPDGSFAILHNSAAFELSENSEMPVFYSKDNDQTLWSLEEQSSSLSPVPDTAKKSIINNDEEVFVIVDTHPEYPGGDEARLEFLRNNIRYPQEAREKSIQGMVYVKFIVEKDGTISNVKVLKGVHKTIDDEAVRVIELMPKWTPGKQKGKTVRVTYNMPIKFTLSTETETKTETE